MTSLYSQLLLVALFLLSMTLLRAYREPGRYGQPYSWVLGAGMLLALWGFDPSGQQAGVVAIGLCLFAVVGPALLEPLGQWLFERGYWSWALQCASLRAVLSFGGKAQEQSELWAALAELQDGGIDAAMAKLRKLLQEAEDPALRNGLNEQILSLNFLAGRWQAGIEHYERHLRGQPSRALTSMGGALVRAYTELERWEEAEDVLEALEGQAEIRPSGFVAQSLAHAQLAFIAAAGKVESIETLVSEEHRLRFALGADGAALMRAIAYRQAGQVKLARQAAASIEDQRGGLAPLGRWMAKTVEESLEGPVPEVPAAARRRAEITARQLLKQLERDATVILRPASWVSLVVMALLVILFILVQLSGGDLRALLQWGMLTPELWRGGAWYRAFTAPYLHLDVLGALLDLYLLWLAGQFCERELGPLRYLAFVLLAPGLAVMLAAWIDPVRAGAGAPLALPIAAMTGCLWVMYRRRNRVIAGRYRGLTLAIALLIVANVLGALSNPMGAQASIITLVLTIFWVSLFFLGSARGLSLPRAGRSPGRERGILALVIAALALWSGAFAAARGQDGPAAMEQSPREECALEGVALSLPRRFQAASDRLSFSLPISNLRGFVDVMAFMTQGAVQVGVVTWPEGPGGASASAGVGGEAPTTDTLSLFAAWPQLRDEFSVSQPKSTLSPAIQALIDAQPQGYRVSDLRRDGRLVARVFERDLRGPAGRKTVVVVSQPAERVDAWAELYAPILEQARPASEEVPQCPAQALPRGPGEGSGSGSGSGPGESEAGTTAGQAGPNAAPDLEA